MRTRQEEKLAACVAHIRLKEGVPAFCEHVNQVVTRTFDINSSCVELARFILRDLGITSQVLRLANSALYNHAGRTIMSVAHAIILLGWDTIRNVLSAIQFVEHFAKGSPGLRELMLLAVMNAVHSRDIASIVGHPHPDEAYICGLFQNLGEVLVACHYPLEYSRIIVAMQTEKLPARAACLRYLDFSWDDVGFHVAQGWNMPSKIQSCLAAACNRRVPQDDQCLTSIASYARDLTHSLYRIGASIDSFALRCVDGPKGEQALVSVRDLKRAVDSAAKEIQQTFSGLGISMERLRLDQQANRARVILESAPIFDAASLDGLAQAIAAAKRSLEKNEFELSALITGLLDSLRACGFEQAVFGLINDKHTFVRGRLASGDQPDEILKRFQFPIDHAEGPILAALGRKTDVLVDRARDDRYDSSALVAALEPAMFALFPIVTDSRVVGCVYADRKNPGAGLNEVRLLLANMRDVMVAAIGKKAPK